LIVTESVSFSEFNELVTISLPDSSSQSPPKAEILTVKEVAVLV